MDISRPQTRSLTPLHHHVGARIYLEGRVTIPLPGGTTASIRATKAKDFSTVVNFVTALTMGSAAPGSPSCSLSFRSCEQRIELLNALKAAIEAPSDELTRARTLFKLLDKPEYADLFSAAAHNKTNILVSIGEIKDQEPGLFKHKLSHSAQELINAIDAAVKDLGETRDAPAARTANTAVLAIQHAALIRALATTAEAFYTKFRDVTADYSRGIEQIPMRSAKLKGMHGDALQRSDSMASAAVRGAKKLALVAAQEAAKKCADYSQLPGVGITSPEMAEARAVLAESAAARATGKGRDAEEAQTAQQKEELSKKLQAAETTKRKLESEAQQKRTAAITKFPFNDVIPAQLVRAVVNSVEQGEVTIQDAINAEATRRIEVRKREGAILRSSSLSDMDELKLQTSLVLHFISVSHMSYSDDTWIKFKNDFQAAHTTARILEIALDLQTAQKLIQSALTPDPSDDTITAAMKITTKILNHALSLAGTSRRDVMMYSVYENAMEAATALAIFSEQLIAKLLPHIENKETRIRIKETDLVSRASYLRRIGSTRDEMDLRHYNTASSELEEKTREFRRHKLQVDAEAAREAAAEAAALLASPVAPAGELAGSTGDAAAALPLGVPAPAPLVTGDDAAVASAAASV